MRWSNQPLPRAAALLSVAFFPTSHFVLAAPLPQAQGEPTEGALSIPAVASDDAATAIGNPSAAHPGAPTVVVGRQETLNGLGVPAENTAPTYNDGMYTPWSPTDAAAADTAAATVETEATANSLYLQPTATDVIGATSIAVISSEAPVSATIPATSAIPTTPPVISSDTTSSTSAVSSSSTISSSASSTIASSSTTSSSSSRISSSSTTGTLDAARQTTTSEKSTNNTKMGVILPVALSLGALALVLAGIGFLVWRRRIAKRRGLAARRYEDAFAAEKGGDYDHGDDFDGSGDHEKSVTDWQTFNRYSTGPYDGIAAGIAGTGVRSLQTPNAGDNDPEAFRPRESRRPLPMTPQQFYEEYASMPPSNSTPQDLDNMIAQSRTGYAPYPDRPQRKKSLMSDIAGSIYSSLSLRSKKSRTGTYNNRSGAGDGQWNEHGAWRQLGEDDAAEIAPTLMYRPKNEQDLPIGSAQDRPLLSAVDETPRKRGYSTYTPPESPSRTGSPARHHNGYIIPRINVPNDGHQLYDNPMPAYSPAGPKRTRSNATQRSEYVPDTPSVYSVTTCEPMSSASPASTYPETLQPGRSPVISRGITPPLPSQHLANRALQRQKSGTTYSLGGMAGLLYSDQQQPPSPAVAEESSYTAMPPRKPRKQSVLSKYKPRTVASPLSDEATAGETDSPNPHRAVSAVVRASRARGSSVDSHNSSETHGTPGWDGRARYMLGQSQASSDSIDDLLSNVLGPNRSPA